MTLARLYHTIPLALGLFGCLLLTGCGKGIRRVPVSGTVLLKGQPMPGGVLNFIPDAAKGNNARVMCSGRIDAGHYQLTTSGVEPTDSGTGVPPGWYKVTLFTQIPGQKEIKVSNVYTRPDTTPLAVEVVDEPAPGAYDVALTK